MVEELNPNFGFKAFNFLCSINAFALKFWTWHSDFADAFFIILQYRGKLRYPWRVPVESITVALYRTTVVKSGNCNSFEAINERIINVYYSDSGSPRLNFWETFHTNILMSLPEFSYKIHQCRTTNSSWFKNMKFMVIKIFIF